MADNKANPFGGPYPEYYDHYLVPMIFTHYAGMVADRAKALAPGDVLETAAGTGAVTRELVRALPSGVRITATDLNQAMIDRARTKPDLDGVSWQVADAMKLPFPGASFDLIVCQFGVMFFPNKRTAFREAARVLRHGGRLLFTAWDDYGAMPDHFTSIGAKVAGAMLDREPLSLVPPGYHDEGIIRADLADAGFGAVVVERASQPSRAPSARDAAIVAVQGSMIRAAIEAVDPTRLDEATDKVERIIRDRFGSGPVEGATKAVIVTAGEHVASSVHVKG